MTTDRGIFIVLEGGDGAGTTTQAERLAASLQQRGMKTHVTAEPSTGPIGLQIRRLLAASAKDESTWPMMGLLFAADRLHHVHNEIEKELAAGTVVICDRYVLSSLVYQGLHLDLDWVKSLNHEALAPDLTLLVDVDLAVARQRRHERDGVQEIYDHDDMQTRVLARYRQLAPLVDARVLDGNGSVDEVASAIGAAVEAFMEKEKN